MKLSISTLFATILSVGLAFIPATVEGHGYMLTPRCRQVYAAEFGLPESAQGGATAPPPEFCPHCHLVGGQTYGVCGTRDPGGRDYTFGWVSNDGNPMPFISQGTYAAGGTILVESVFTANHEGHIVVGLCADVANPTQACFDSNQLEFVEDPLYGAPKDVNYPERGYIAPDSADAQTSPEFSPPIYTDGNIDQRGLLVQHLFRLPDDIVGEVLLQWHWVSNLGCRSVGYDVYPWPAGWEPYGSMSTVCALPMPDIGNSPQQYWQCAEITITGDTPAPVTAAPVAPTISPAPIVPTTPAPVTSAPVTGAPVEIPANCRYCCSLNGEGCPAWDNECFTEDRCGVTNNCQWQGQQWLLECDGDATTPAPIPLTTSAPVSPVAPITPAPVTPVAPITPAPVTPAPVTAAPVETPDGCKYCCSINGQGCPSWDNGCFTEDKCGVTNDCLWQSQEWVLECNEDETASRDPNGCCAQNGVCPEWPNPCFTIDKCGIEDPSTNTSCGWGGQLSWLNPAVVLP